MKALFIGSYPNPVEPYKSVFFRELIYQMADQGVECTVISCASITAYKTRIRNIPQYQEEKTAAGNKIRVYRPHIISYSAKKIGKWNTIHATQKSVETAVMKVVKSLDETFDFVYGHFFLCAGLVAAKVAQRYGIPAYIAYGECSFHTEVESKYGPVGRKEMEGVKGIIAVSSANKEDIMARDFAKDIPVCLSLNAIDPTVFHKKDKQACRAKLGLPAEEFIVGFVGYFIERKGPGRVLEACKDLSNVKLAFAGRGGEQPEGENVIFCRALPHEDVADFLNAVDVFCLPTLHEGCCNAVVEAMACGKAIISSDLPFNHDVLNGKNAILVDPNSVEQIRSAVTRLYEEEQLRKNMEQQALEDAQRLTLPQRARTILDFINTTSRMEKNEN